MLSGCSAVDESSITGEASTVAKRPNSTVTAGTVNWVSDGNGAEHRSTNPAGALLSTAVEGLISPVERSLCRGKSTVISAC